MKSTVSKQAEGLQALLALETFKLSAELCGSRLVGRLDRASGQILLSPLAFGFCDSLRFAFSTPALKFLTLLIT